MEVPGDSSCDFLILKLHGVPKPTNERKSFINSWLGGMLWYVPRGMLRNFHCFLKKNQIIVTMVEFFFPKSGGVPLKNTSTGFNL